MMNEWIKYSSNLNPVFRRFLSPTEKYEVKENTFVKDSIFDDLGDDGAILINGTSTSFLVSSSLFSKCRNVNNGAAISHIPTGTGSFGLTKSCIDGCRVYGSSMGASFCFNGQTGCHIVNIDHCSITNNACDTNDGISIWRADSFVANVNASRNNGQYYAGISSGYGVSSTQRYVEYSELESRYSLLVYNNVSTFFRCLFRCINPLEKSIFICRTGPTYLESCCFKECSNFMFSVVNNGTLFSNDCFFENCDLIHESDPNIFVFSPNTEFVEIFSYIRMRDCLDDSHRNSYLPKFYSIFIASLNFLN